MLPTLTPFLTSFSSASSKDIRPSVAFHQAPQHPPPGCSSASTRCLLPSWTLPPNSLGIRPSCRLRRRGLGGVSRDILRFRPAPQRYPNCRTQTRLGQQALALSPRSELDTENPGPHSGHRDPWDLVPRPASRTQPVLFPHRSPQAEDSQPSQRSAATRWGFLPRWSPLPASAPSFRPLPVSASCFPAPPAHPSPLPGFHVPQWL